MTIFSKQSPGRHPALAEGLGAGVRGQRGSTLLVGLIMLVLLTLVAVSAINATTTSVQMVGNAQFREEATAAAQQAIEKVISNGDFRSVPPNDQDILVNGVATYHVTFVPRPECVSVRPVDPTDPAVPRECASSIGTVCFWTLWDIKANVTDLKSGASLAVHQGVRTIAGLNTATTSCGV